MLKKILSLLLALLMVVSIVSCADEPEDPQDDPGKQEDPGTDDPGTDDPGKQDPAPVFTETNETVFVNVSVELRTTPAIDSGNVVGVLRFGQAVTRIGLSEEWSKVHIDVAGFDPEKDYYVATKCLTNVNPVDPGTDDPGTDDPGTDDPANPENPGTDDPGTDDPGTDDPANPENPTDADFVAVDPPKTVYVISDALNLRSKPTTLGNTQVGAVLFGSELTLVAKSAEWSRVRYDGKEYYVYSEFISENDVFGKNYIPLETPVKMMLKPSSTSVNVRVFASMSAHIAHSLVKGEAVLCVALEDDSNPWAKVQIGNNYYFIINSQLVEADPDTELLVLDNESDTPVDPPVVDPTQEIKFVNLTSRKLMYTTESIKIYTEPSTLSAPAKTVNKGISLTCVAQSEDGSWMKIADGEETFYVLAKYLKAAKG